MMKQQYQHMMDGMALSDGKRAQILERLDRLPAAPAARKRRPVRTLHVALAAAALAAAVPVAAFAAGALVVDDHGQVRLGRFALGIVVDENGRNVKTGKALAIGKEARRSEYSGYIDPAQVQTIDGQTVVAPSQTNGAELVAEDGRMMLYYCCGPLDTALDISEELRRDGGYTVSEAQDGYQIEVTVYPSDDPEDGQVFEGTAYRVKGKGSYPGNFTGTQSFTFDTPHYVSGNVWNAREPLDENGDPAK